MNTKTNGFQTTYEPGDLVEVEVEHLNERGRGYAICSLPAGYNGIMPFGLCGQERLDTLQEPRGDEPGSTFTVRVLEAYMGSDNRWHILLSERHVEERLFHQHVERNVIESDVLASNKVPAHVLESARQRLAQNHTIRGVVAGDAPGGGKRVDIGKFIAILSREDLCGISADSLRKGVTVKVKFKDVSENGITLTRKGVA
jgi:hypothetical protein